MNKTAKDYINAKIEYRISEPVNDNKYLLIKEALASFGVNLNVYNDILSIDIIPDKFIIEKKRNAGRKSKINRFENYNAGLKNDRVMFSDIIYMQQTLSDIEIQNNVGMTHATYYRHKKKLLNSKYYQMLDKSKLNDQEYLKSLWEFDQEF